MVIDVTFDFQAEANYRDSDRWSPTLQHYHSILWSKPLPDGTLFKLEKISQNKLRHASRLGEFILSSDRAVPIFQKHPEHKKIILQLPTGTFDAFRTLTDTIGGIVLWPGRRINGKMTINGARGFHPLISDRLDLTLECIRRYYLGKPSPLYNTFVRYNNFFQLFSDFRGYIEFFLLQDMVEPDYSSVKIAPPYDNFFSHPVPKNLDEYTAYMNYTTGLVKNRNRRIDEWQKRLQASTRW